LPLKTQIDVGSYALNAWIKCGSTYCKVENLEELMSDESNGGSKLAFLLAGMGIGAILALLFAPKSGEETRELISRKAGEGRDYVKAKGLELRQDAEDLVEKAKGVVNQQKEQLSAALEAGKQAYHEEKAKSR
jgi:gas vesicle protein